MAPQSRIKPVKVLAEERRSEALFPASGFKRDILDDRLMAAAMGPDGNTTPALNREVMEAETDAERDS